LFRLIIIAGYVHKDNANYTHVPLSGFIHFSHSLYESPDYKLLVWVVVQNVFLVLGREQKSFKILVHSMASLNSRGLTDYFQ
jgi:hypothetical protein